MVKMDIRGCIVLGFYISQVSSSDPDEVAVSRSGTQSPPRFDPALTSLVPFGSSLTTPLQLSHAPQAKRETTEVQALLDCLTKLRGVEMLNKLPFVDCQELANKEEASKALTARVRRLRGQQQKEPKEI